MEPVEVSSFVEKVEKVQEISKIYEKIDMMQNVVQTHNTVDFKPKYIQLGQNYFVQRPGKQK